MYTDSVILTGAINRVWVHIYCQFNCLLNEQLMWKWKQTQIVSKEYERKYNFTGNKNQMGTLSINWLKLCA